VGEEGDLMVKRGTRLVEGVNVTITKIDQISTPQPTLSDKDAADLCQKVRYLIDQIETLNAKDFATQTTLNSVLSQLDITLSALRDALRGTANKDFSTLEADVESINAKVATESTLSSINGKVATESTLSSIDTKVATESTLSSIDAKVATESTLSSIRTQLDIALSELKATGTQTPRTLSELYDELASIDAKDFATESTLSGILAKLDIALSEIKATGAETPRTLSNLYDQLSSLIAKDFATETTLSSIDSKVATESTLSSINTKVATESTLSSILSQLDITLSSLRDALLAEEHVYSQLINADETAAQSITLDTKGHKMLEVYASATAATTFTLEVSHDNTNWIPVYTSPSPETTYGGDRTFWNGYRYARLSSATAGAAGDTVSLYLGAK